MMALLLERERGFWVLFFLAVLRRDDDDGDEAMTETIAG
jgi:hypothetical protein